MLAVSTSPVASEPSCPCEIDALLKKLVAQTAPELCAIDGVGTDVASAILVAAGDNPERLKSEATFAKLCGVSPLWPKSDKQRAVTSAVGGSSKAPWSAKGI